MSDRFNMRRLLRLSVLLAFAVSVFSSPGIAAPSKPSLSAWSKAKHGKVLVPDKSPPPAPAPKATASAPKPAASAGAKAKAKAEGPAVTGKVAVLGFTGEGAAHVQQAVVSSLRTRGLQVTTGLRPVDTAEQYREMAATLQLAAYIDGSVGGAGPRGQATVHVRSGVTGRRIASIHVSGDRGTLAADVGDKLWPKTGPQLTRLCAEAAKPHKGPRRAMRIDAGTPLDNQAPDDYLPPHLRNEPPKGRQKDDPWADEP